MEGVKVAEWRRPEWADDNGPTAGGLLPGWFAWALLILGSLTFTTLLMIAATLFFNHYTSHPATIWRHLDIFILANVVIVYSFYRTRYVKPVGNWLELSKKADQCEFAVTISDGPITLGRDFGFAEIKEGMLTFSGYFCDFRISAADVLIPAENLSEVSSDAPYVDVMSDNIGSKWHRMAWGFYLASQPSVRVFFSRNGQSPTHFREDLYRWKLIDPPQKSGETVLPPLTKQGAGLGDLAPFR